MPCACGCYHTVTISDCGEVHSFGRNVYGQLGLGHDKEILEMGIPNLPQIKMVSCGPDNTICIDYEGFLWSFGSNSRGQLGTGISILQYNVPQKIIDIPPVDSVSCGYAHTLIITNDLDLWSCGDNEYGQLCLGNKEIKLKFTKTSFSNITKISTGFNRSLFQNDKGEIYVCGYNVNGGLGLGSFENCITPTLIPNLPPNIVQPVSGYYHTLFLDSKGNVFSVGCNEYGQLGLAHWLNQETLIQIPNIPPIQSISCNFHSSFLIDVDENVWSFGNNTHGQLGHGDTEHRNIPTKIQSLKHIQQISYGSCAYGHFLAKDDENKIFVSGYNGYKQLGRVNTTATTAPSSIPQEMDSKYFTIWGDIRIQSRIKSARK